MTQTTDARQLRLLIEGVLQAFGITSIEYPELSFKMTDAIRKYIADGNAEPVRTREKILSEIEHAVGASTKLGNQKQDIFDEINRRVGIRPLGKDWEGFIEHCIIQSRSGKTITKFLDWWLEDEWQRTHPPTRPDGWFVKWDLAFNRPAQIVRPEYQVIRAPEPSTEPQPVIKMQKPASLLGE